MRIMTAAQLRQVVSADAFLARAIEEFIDRRVKRFGAGSDPDWEHEHERDYLLSEVCMSVYCREVLGFCNEVWERPPAPEIPDPLKLLYAHRPRTGPSGLRAGRSFASFISSFRKPIGPPIRSTTWPRRRAGPIPFAVNSPVHRRACQPGAERVERCHA